MASKRFKAVKDKVNVEKQYNLADACELAVSTATAKFDEGIDVAIILGVDPKKADQNVRGTVPLPHGTGKKITVAVFAKGDKAEQAKAAGAEYVGGDDLVEKVKGGFLDFDAVVAAPDMMVQVGKVGKILGPKGLMPSPKVGTVTADVGEAVRLIKAGRVEFKVEKAGIVHTTVGKRSFGGSKISENVKALVEAINRAKPSSSKGVYLRSLTVAATMGPGVAVNVEELR